MMMTPRSAALLSLVSVACAGSVAPCAESTTSEAFVTRCRTSSRDLGFFPSGLDLALVHEVGQSTTEVERVSGDKIVPFAWLHHDSKETKEFVEAEGGMESTLIASDVVQSMRRQPFVLVKDWRATLARPDVTVPPCDISYDRTRRYRGE